MGGLRPLHAHALSKLAGARDMGSANSLCTRTGKEGGAGGANAASEKRSRADSNGSNAY
jgi:hypothetical protein